MKLVYESINELKDSNMKIAYMKNKSKTDYYGYRYGQSIEPAGEYMIMDELYEERPDKYMLPNYEYGFIKFYKPLILDFMNTTDKGWEKTLSDKYNGLTGKRLSNAIKKDGYDGIVTVSNYGIEEIVNLCENKEILFNT